MAGKLEGQPAEARIDAAKRRNFVLEMRRVGGSYRQIAEAAVEEFGASALPSGWDERYACNDIKRELDRLREVTNERAADLRDIELTRLDEMQSRVYPVALGSETVPPDMRAVDRVLRIMERRAKLTGIDAVEKKLIEIQDLSDAELIKRAKSLIGDIDTPEDGDKTKQERRI